MRYIVTTTIHAPTPATMKFLSRPDWHMVIVGDLKTPHDDYIELEKHYPQLHYMHPDEQDRDYKELSDAIGWNKIMRRNLGFCYAYKQGADIVASIDDDNIPYDDWGQDVYVGKTITVDSWEAISGYFDPLSVTNACHTWHRGYPLKYVSTRRDLKYMGKIQRKILMQADLWDGIPDVDAMSRIIYNPRIKLNVEAPYCSVNIAPFNSQNTFFSREVIPYYMVIPHIGRMDDIWASYIVQKLFPNTLIFNKATVYQERYEPHSRNIKDLKDELLGYEYTLEFIEGEFKLPSLAQKAYDLYTEGFKKYV